MASIVHILTALLLAFNYVASAKEFTCEGWRQLFTKDVEDRIQCGDGGMIIVISTVIV